MSLDTNLLDGPYRTVFDVGAFVGDFARACLDAWPDCEVDSFEPIATPAHPIDERRQRWHRVALAAAAGRATMYECEFVPSSSLLPMADLHRQAFPYTENSVARPTFTDVLASYAGLVVPPALLKIDVQGYELEVLRGAGDTLRLFQAVVLEVSWQTLYDGAPTADDLDVFLRDAGFDHVRCVEELRHPETNALLQSDELWARA